MFYFLLLLIKKSFENHIFSLSFLCSSEAADAEEWWNETYSLHSGYFLSPLTHRRTTILWEKLSQPFNYRGKNCCTYDLMFVLYFLWPFRPGLLKHRCYPNITIPLCRAGHSVNEKHTHLRPEEKVCSTRNNNHLWWTSPNNQALLNLVPLKYNLKSKMCPEPPRKRIWFNRTVKCHGIKADMWEEKKSDNEKPCIITSKFSDKTVKILSCFMFTPYHASFLFLEESSKNRCNDWQLNFIMIHHKYYTSNSDRSTWQQSCWQFSLGAVCLAACGESESVCVLKFSVKTLQSPH